ncbi:MAG TPA: hypothetical protein VJ784_14255 [Pyrinomonadaceae bacterium]|nr:hypothetical protein [Pyrinomonadaceae bacterium]
MVTDRQTDPEGGDQGLGSSRIRWAVAIATLVAIGVYIGYVVLHENVRRDYFVQRLTTVILILGVVVILFALFKNLVNIRLPIVGGPVPQKASAGAITLIGAAGLLWLLLGPIKNLIFPPDQIFSGNIYYKINQNGDPLEPVKDVVVQVPETDQKSQPSSEDGRFTITNLTFHPEDVNALYGGLVYPFEPGKYRHSRYDVINRPAIPPKTTS